MKDFEDTFRSRLGRFVEQVDDGVAPDEIDDTGADGLAAQKVLQAAIDSLESETVVHIQQGRETNRATHSTKSWRV
jgi:hypothetical protein